MAANLASILTDTAQRCPDRPAVKLGDSTLTYAQLDGAVARCAGLLRRLGVQPGDRVGIMLPNVPYFPIAYYAILRVGAVVVPMNVLLKGRETSFYLSDSGAKVIFAWMGFADAAKVGAEAANAELVVVTPGEFEKLLGGAEPVTEVAERDANDTAVILYTSGTTGTPKGAELTHANMLSNAQSTAKMVSATEEDRFLGALPLFHSFGQTASMNLSVYVGAMLSLLPKFSAKECLGIIAADKITIFLGVPTMYVALVQYPEAEEYDVSSLRLCISGGAAIPVEVLRSFEKRYDAIVLEGYGLSETSPVASFNHPGRERKPGSIGTPISGVELKLVDDDGKDVPQGEVGEICIRGENVMKGYWQRPEATESVMKDGWFATGDMARTDEEGYYFIVDRKKDMIIRAGYNVYPREIEEVLYEHPAVAEAAVIGTPHPEFGEEVAAVVVLKVGASATPEELRDHVKAQVAAYKYPRRVVLAEELPHGPTGKVLKREIHL
ncbi:MAG: long-chain fatty acid--CoA ligase [Frankiaceae bacterium]